MKRIFAAIALALPVACAYAQDPAPAEAQQIETPDPSARFQGKSIAQVYNEGVRYQRQNDFANALPCFQHLADQGHVESQYVTGHIYFYGKAGNKDNDQAIKYWTLAAEQNHTQSQFELGLLYFGIDEFANALKYWEMAANNGSGASMSNIGMCYDEGKGVACDEEKALQWYMRAAEMNDGRGYHNLGMYYEQGKGGLARDLNKALECYNKSWSLSHYPAKESIDRVTQIINNQ